MASKARTYSNGIPTEFHRIPDAVLPKYASSTEKDVLEAHARLGETWAKGTTLPLAYRKLQLLSLRRAIVENYSIIVEALVRDFKSPGEASMEVHMALHEIVTLIENMQEWTSPKKAGLPLLFSQDSAAIHYEPYGVLLNISPWNFPFDLCISPLVGAIAAGNCCVVKPSELSINTSAVIKYLLERYLDSRCVACFLGDKELATFILQQKWDFIVYTGNSSVGRIVMSAASKHLTPVCLELGGKTPAIVDDRTCDLKTTARRLAWGKFLNCGQVCIAVDYVICHPRVKDELVKLISEEFDRLLVYKNTDEYTRVINKDHVSRMAKLLPTDDSPPSHGSIVYGGDYDVEDRYFQPTIVTNVDPHSSPLMQNELFAPILPIVEIESMEDAITFIKSKSKPLSMYVFSEDSALINKLNSCISSGSVCINDVMMTYLMRSLPFGGVGESGINAYHGQHSIQLFSHKKAVYRANHSKLAEKVMFVRYPPIQQESLMSLSFPNNHYPLKPSDNKIILTINSLFATIKSLVTVAKVILGF